MKLKGKRFWPSLLAGFAPTLTSVQLHLHSGRANSGHVHTHRQYDDPSH